MRAVPRRVLLVAMLLVHVACGRVSRSQDVPSQPPVPARPPVEAPSASPSPPRLSATTQPVPPPATAAAPEDARKVLVGLRTLAERHELSAMAPFLFGHSRQLVPRMKPEDVLATLSGEVTGAEVNGGRVLLRLKGNPKARLAAFFLTDNGFKYDIEVSMKYREPDAGPRIPENRPLPLADATRGIAGKGPLVATIETSMGTFTCTLFEDKAPLAVANFVALARGLRAFRDVKTGKWVKRPFYDGLTFHRVIPRFMIQGGCPKGNGSGDPGYAFADEFDLALRHDRPGRISLANSGPNTNGSQFFITEVPTPWLDDHHAILGACEPIELVRDVARVAATDSRPSEPVVIRHVQFRREE